MGDPVYLRPRDVAERLDVKVNAVLHWLHTRELAGVNVAQVAGRRPRWRISQDELWRFLERRTVATTPGRSRRQPKARQPAPRVFYHHGKRVREEGAA